MRFGAALIAAVGAVSCTSSHGGDAAVGERLDAGVDVGRFDVPARDCGGPATGRDVGVLFVMQSFGSSGAPRYQARDASRALLPRLRERTSGTLRFAAITGDSGPGGIRGNGCEIPGRDGVLLDGSERMEPAPSAILTLAPGDPIEPFLDWTIGVLDDAFNDECVNQVLESTLRAITPSTVPVSLPAHGSVHGDRETAGLVEPGDVLLIVFVTDAEDCSWSEVVPANPPDARVPFCEGTARCCPEVLYPSAERYVPAFRAAADALDVDLAFALISAVPEADVSLADWRSRGAPDTEICGFETPSIYRHMPWRIFETLDAFEPFVTTQPRCDPDYDAIADVVSNVACATAP